MIEALLPATVQAVETFADVPETVLHPVERACVARAVEIRRREFATGRHCARLALRRLGYPPVAIGKGERGAPSWPAGVVGSITHCTGYRAAAVALTTRLRTIGIDAEPHEPLPAGVLDLVSLPSERLRLAGLADAVPGVCWDRVLFSAKESVYKAWFPLTGAWLGFHEADIRIDPSAGTFVARLLAPGAAALGDAPGELTGRFGVLDGFLLTAVAR